MGNKKLNRILSKRIKELRIQRGLTIEQLAYQSEISKGGLSEIERYKKEPRLYTIMKICSTLRITVSEFFSLDKINKFTSRL